MFSYCGNSPVNRADYTGQFWSEIWEFTKTAVNEIGKAMGNMSPAYVGCGGVAVADGPLPFGDAIGLIGVAALTIRACGYGIYQAVHAPAISVPKVEENEKDVAIPHPRHPSGGMTYYHVTTPSGAAEIMSKGFMIGSIWEGGHVFAWRIKPNEYAILNSGAHFGTIISFKTNALFINDNGIKNHLVKIFGPVVSATPGPIVVWDVQIVG